jgi:hypothetical protein
MAADGSEISAEAEDGDGPIPLSDLEAGQKEFGAEKGHLCMPKGSGWSF